MVAKFNLTPSMIGDHNHRSNDLNSEVPQHRAALQLGDASKPRTDPFLPFHKFGPGQIFYMLLCCVLSLTTSVGWAEDISFSGKCLLTSYDLSSGHTRTKTEWGFTFARSGQDWMVEIKTNALVPGFERIRWVSSGGILYRTEFAANPQSDVIPRVLAITTNRLPEFGWHCAIPLLLIFVPDAVLQLDPPSIPRTTFLPDDPEQPGRLWCQYENTGTDYRFVNLRVYGERSASTPPPPSPQMPADPLLLFECRISKFSQYGGIQIPAQFVFRACYPRGVGTPEDVTTSWDVKGEIDQASLSPIKSSLLRIEGKTLVADYRIQTKNSAYTSYLTTNSILDTNSAQFKELTNTSGIPPNTRVSPKTTIILGVIVMFSLLMVYFMTRSVVKKPKLNK